MLFCEGKKRSCVHLVCYVAIPCILTVYLLHHQINGIINSLHAFHYEVQSH